MNFNEILPELLAGKHATCSALGTNILSLEAEDQQFFIWDGLGDFPIYGLRDKFILATDWKIVEAPNKKEK